MADVNSAAVQRPPDDATATPGSGPRAPADEARLVAMVELLFFAYRDFVAEPDQILAELGFGRAHHRVLHFVNRQPGLRVADLLDVLQITKQSLARVLKQLVEQGYILQETGPTDRRERRLHPTDAGRRLARRLLALQTARLEEALEGTGPGGAEMAARFLAGVISETDRTRAEALFARVAAKRAE